MTKSLRAHESLKIIRSGNNNKTKTMIHFVGFYRNNKKDMKTGITSRADLENFNYFDDPTSIASSIVLKNMMLSSAKWVSYLKTSRKS